MPSFPLSQCSPKRPRHPLATPSSSSSITHSPPPSPPRKRPRVPPHIPDEILIAIFRHFPLASSLAQLRPVCRQWCRIIDSTPLIWRHVSFHHASFLPHVSLTSTNALTLSKTPGKRLIQLAANAGNEWAAFLREVVFDGGGLRAITVPQPGASAIVNGKGGWDVAGVEGWVAVHAARRCGAGGEVMARGALVGVVRIGAHRVERAVRLKRPIRCAGYVGIWKVGSWMTGVLVEALQNQ